MAVWFYRIDFNAERLAYLFKAHILKISEHDNGVLHFFKFVQGKADQPDLFYFI